jgi:hypothetical protein
MVDVEDGKTFLYEDGKPVALQLRSGKALTITSPEGGDERPAFRIGRFNVTQSGNFTVSYSTTLSGGANEEGNVHLPEPVNGRILPEGHTRVPVTRFVLKNNGEDEEGVLSIHRITINVC